MHVGSAAMTFLAKHKFDFESSFTRGLPCMQLGKLNAQTLALVLDPNTTDYLPMLCEWLDRDKTLDELLFAAENRKTFSKKVNTEVAAFKQAVESLIGNKTEESESTDMTVDEKLDSTAADGKKK